MSDALRHALRVAGGLHPRYGPSYRVAAFLHDSIEDGWASEDEIRAAFWPEVAETVVALTRREDEAYDAYIARLAREPGGTRAIKKADLRDNYARCGGAFGGILNPGLAKRYARALETLGEPIATEQVSE